MRQALAKSAGLSFPWPTAVAHGGGCASAGDECLADRARPHSYGRGTVKPPPLLASGMAALGPGAEDGLAPTGGAR